MVIANKLCVNDHSCPSSISQYAGIDALEGQQDEIINSLENFKPKLNKIESTIKSGSKTILSNVSVLNKDLIINENDTLDISNLKRLFFENNANMYIYGTLINNLEKKSIWEVKNGRSSIFIKSQSTFEPLLNLSFGSYPNLAIFLKPKNIE